MVVTGYYLPLAGSTCQLQGNSWSTFFSVGILLSVSSSHDRTSTSCALQLLKSEYKVVLSSDGERSDRILDSVVVDIVSAIKDITAQAWEKSVRVDQSSAHL